MTSPRDALVALTKQDRRAGVWVAAQLARTVLPYVPTREKRPLEAIEAAEGWVRDTVTAAEVKNAAREALRAADRMSLTFSGAEWFTPETYAAGIAANVAEMAADPAFGWNSARGVVDLLSECALEVLVRDYPPSVVGVKRKEIAPTILALIAHHAENAPRQNPRAADPSMLSLSGRPIGKFLGYFRPGSEGGHIIAGVFLQGTSVRDVVVGPFGFASMFYWDKGDRRWIEVALGLFLADTSEVRLTNNTETLRGPTRLLVKERNRVAVYAVG